MSSALQVSLFSEPAPPAVPTAPRNFYRCADCLTIAAVDGRSPAGTLCGACDGPIEHMGEVYRTSLRQLTGYEAPCDHRCTGARGPDCECSCGGANHGTGLVVPVFEYQGVPRLQVVNPRARMVADEWRGLVAEYRAAWAARFGALADAKRRGVYLSGGEYSRYLTGCELAGRWQVIRGRRTGARVKALQGLIAEVKK